MTDELSPELRALLREGAEGPRLRDGATDRVLSRVLTTVGIAAAASAATAASSVSAASSTGVGAGAASASSGAVASAAVSTTSIVAKVVLGAVVVTSAVGGTAVALKKQAAPPAVSSVSSVSSVSPPSPPSPPAPPAAPSTTVLEEPLELELGPEPKSRPERPRAEVSEATLLERARSALAAHDEGLALSALDEHARRHERGQLVEEREALRVVALMRLQRTAEARLAAQAFAARFPASLLLPTVEAAIAPVAP